MNYGVNNKGTWLRLWVLAWFWFLIGIGCLVFAFRSNSNFFLFFISLPYFLPVIVMKFLIQKPEE